MDLEIDFSKGKWRCSPRSLEEWDAWQRRNWRNGTNRARRMRHRALWKGCPGGLWENYIAHFWIFSSNVVSLLNYPHICKDSLIQVWVVIRWKMMKSRTCLNCPRAKCWTLSTYTHPKDKHDLSEQNCQNPEDKYIFLSHPRSSFERFFLVQWKPSTLLCRKLHNKLGPIFYSPFSMTLLIRKGLFPSHIPLTKTSEEPGVTFG